MVQKCTDCGEKNSDSSNYCVKCRAKLPNAKKFLPDYKRIALDPEYNDPEEFMKVIESCIRDQKFRDRVLLRILERAFKRLESDSKYENFYADEVMGIFIDEVKKRTLK